MFPMGQGRSALVEYGVVVIANSLTSGAAPVELRWTRRW